jgi:tetratricopeptide (TPR) repeat protein
MAEEQTSSAGKAAPFFDRASQAADMANWDYAIELYLEGIARDPDNIEKGHQPLREVSLRRKVAGGKNAGMMEAFKHRGGKDPVEKLVNAEYLLAKDPGKPELMLGLLKAAQEAGKPEIVNWIGRILLEAQRTGKTNKSILIQLADAFEQIEQYSHAVAACQLAISIAPDDATLLEKLKNLSANETIKRGRYDEEGDVTRSVKDMDAQKQLFEQDRIVQGDDYLKRQMIEARKEYVASPTVPGKVNAYVDALLKTEDEGDEDEAIDVLTKAHAETGSYQFKIRVGDVRIRQLTRRYRKLVASGDKAAAVEQARKQLAFELAEFTDRAANYPTDLAVKFELGKRQFLAGRYDDAIGTLQQAQRDPRRHVPALNYLGQAFARKGWHQEAAETYERALQAEIPEGRKKEIYYNLADTFEKMDKLDRAEELFSDLAQMDFNFKDVRNRVDAIRKKKASQAGQ